MSGLYLSSLSMSGLSMSGLSLSGLSMSGLSMSVCLCLVCLHMSSLSMSGLSMSGLSLSDLFMSGLSMSGRTMSFSVCFVLVRSVTMPDLSGLSLFSTPLLFWQSICLSLSYLVSNRLFLLLFQFFPILSTINFLYIYALSKNPVITHIYSINNDNNYY